MAGNGKGKSARALLRNFLAMTAPSPARNVEGRAAPPPSRNVEDGRAATTQPRNFEAMAAPPPVRNVDGRSVTPPSRNFEGKAAPPPARNVDRRSAPPPPRNGKRKFSTPPSRNFEAMATPPPPRNVEAMAAAPPPRNGEGRSAPPPPINVKAMAAPPPPRNVKAIAAPPPTRNIEAIAAPPLPRKGVRSSTLRRPRVHSVPRRTTNGQGIPTPPPPRNGEGTSSWPPPINSEGTSAPQLPPPLPQIRLPSEPGGSETTRVPPYVSYGLSTGKWRRPRQTDAVMIMPSFVPLHRTLDYFGMYDGHFGDAVANYLHLRLHAAIRNEMILDLSLENSPYGNGKDEWWEGIMRFAFAAVDEEVVRASAFGSLGDLKIVGAGALAVVVYQLSIALANCGTSRAVLSRGGVAEQLTMEHRPTRPDEKRRLEAAGCLVNARTGKLNNIIPVSRGFGSVLFKEYVIAEPEVVVVDRTLEDEFLVLATDGLWDYMTPNAVCDFVRRGLRKGKLSPEAAAANMDMTTVVAHALARLALMMGSKDNISIVIVELNDMRAQGGA